MMKRSSKGKSGMHGKLSTPSAPYNIKGKGGKRGKSKKR